MIMNKKRQEIFNKSNGKCWYCGCDLQEKGWHADHFEAIVRRPIITGYEIVKRESFHGVDMSYSKPVYGISVQNKSLDNQDNLVPACAPCNIMKGKLSIEGFRRLIVDQKRLLLNKPFLRNAVRFGAIEITDHPVVFWFEKEGDDE
ncbi:HNH endonuclease [Vibrio phage K375]